MFWTLEPVQGFDESEEESRISLWMKTGFSVRLDSRGEVKTTNLRGQMIMLEVFAQICRKRAENGIL